MPDPDPASPSASETSAVAPAPGQAVGDALAAELHEMAVPADRPTAVRDVIHEMIQAGAEGEISPALVEQELPPEPFSDADYAAYEAAHAEDEAGTGT